ncbi:MAG TPA: putative quinol monooxygenase [Vicinamibacterales bacterium]|nr:putative quinol monooxygenase [Vicinamibacterales bacterium]
MYVILGIIKVKPAHLEAFVTHVRQHAARSLTEPGCVRYDVLQDAADPHTVCLYEVFRSEADLQVHHAQDYYQRWMTLSRDWRDHSTYSRRVLRTLYPPDAEWEVRS